MSASTGPAWRFSLGIVCFIAAFAIHLVTLAAIAVGASAAMVGSIAAINFAVNKGLLVVAAAIMGRPRVQSAETVGFRGGQALRPPGRNQSDALSRRPDPVRGTDLFRLGVALPAEHRSCPQPTYGECGGSRGTRCSSSAFSFLAADFGTSCAHSLFATHT